MRCWSGTDCCGAAHNTNSSGGTPSGAGGYSPPATTSRRGQRFRYHRPMDAPTSGTRDRPLQVFVIVSDLMFQARIADALRALDVEPVLVDGEVALAGSLADAPAAAVIDLHERSLDALAAVGVLHDCGVAILAFGRHTEPALLRAAREAGAQAAVPRSQLVDELPELLRSLIAASTPKPG